MGDDHGPDRSWHVIARDTASLGRAAGDRNGIPDPAHNSSGERLRAKRTRFARKATHLASDRFPLQRSVEALLLWRQSARPDQPFAASCSITRTFSRPRQDSNLRPSD
jgi:hypothetical protein